MDPSGPAGHTEPLDLLAPAAEAPGSRPGESLIWVQDAIVFSGDYAATGGSLPAQAPLSPEHQGVSSCSLEVAAWDCEVPAGEFACVSGLGGGPAECTPGSSPGPELPTMEFPPPLEEVLQVGNPQAWDEGANDAQALIWAGILQAQQCMLELQGALEKQEEPAAELSSQAQGPEDAPSCGPATQSSQAWPVSCEPLGERTGLASSSEEEPEAGPGGQEEEEEESASSEEEQHLFYNNPLFQESPRTGPSPCGSPAGGHGTAPEGTPVLGAPPEGELWHQGAEAEAPGEVPAYTPHCGSWAPLLITEGDIDRARSMTEEPEQLLGTCGSNTSLPALQDPDQPADGAACHPPVLLGSGESGAAEDPLGSGLLFSPSGSSVVWALLQEKDGAQPSPCEGPLSPAPDRGSSSPVHPAEPVLHPEVAWGLPASGHGDLAPPSLGAEASPSVSCPQGEAAEAEALPESLAGEERKPGDVAQGQATEEPGEEAKQELTVRCPEEEDAGETPGDPEAAQPDGPILANGASGDKGAAWRLAARLYRLDGFKKSQVASYLRKNNEFSQQVAEEYLAFFQFGGQTLDRALRSFLKAFVLTGETQERERILGHFSKRYHLSNPDAFPSADTVHTLTCALMLLNTDLHGQNIGRSMTCHEFVTNLDGMKDGQNFPKEQLKALYSSIRNEKLEWAMDEEEQGSALMPRRPSTPSSRKKSNPFLTLAHDANAATYKQGLLARKVHAEADGKKTPWGKRGWKTFHTVLKGMVLYFLKDESQVEVAGTEEPIGVHHALAERASKYNKRPHVFRLQTADWRIFLFQALSAEEMSSWISRINLVAAMFSSPPFPAAVGSQRKFIRPILPTAQSRSSLEEQHQAHETCMDKFTDELGEHQRNLPDKRGRGRDLEEYRLKKEYLLYEKRRYETYVRLLEARLQGGPEELEQWEARLGGLDLADEGLGLTKSHSSPSLNLDPAPTGVKVKRNISERRTVRKIIPKRNKQLL